MLSRVAENLYWIARYVERAENTTRLLDQAFHLELDAGRPAPGELGPLESVLHVHACYDQFIRSGGDVTDRDQIVQFLLLRRNNESSIRTMIARARENARGTQDTLSAEIWSQLNEFYLFLSGRRAVKRFESGQFRFFERVKRECLLFTALIENTLLRNEVYHFLEVGRYLERIDMLSRILSVHIRRSRLIPAGPIQAHAELPTPNERWQQLLQCCSGYESYLKLSLEQIEPVSVLEFLMLNADFPRSMRFAVSRCLESLRAIAGGERAMRSDAERRLGRLDSELRYMDLPQVWPGGLADFLVSVRVVCGQTSSDIYQSYFLY